MLRIKELRNSKKESQTDLSLVVGVSLRTIQNYEEGNVSVSVDNLKLIAQHYDVSVSYLFSSDKENSEADLKGRKKKRNYPTTDPINGLQDYSAFEIMEHILLNTTKFQENETYKLFIENVKKPSNHRLHGKEL